MAIPPKIYQTFKTERLPLITRWHIYKLKKRNPDFEYHFFKDEDILNFIKSEFDEEVYCQYQKLNIGAAKADFFRYAILFKFGGIYLDIDSVIREKISSFVSIENDSALISLGKHKKNYVQWALFYESGHPFLEETWKLVIDNIKTNRYPYDVHKMTEPTVYTQAINNCLQKAHSIMFRELSVDYDQKAKFSYLFSKFSLYGIKRKGHWKNVSKFIPVLK